MDPGRCPRTEASMQDVRRGALVTAAILSLALASAAENKTFRYTVTPGASVSIVNDYGQIKLHAAPGNQVIVNASPRSTKVEVDCSQNGNRIDVRTHFLQKASEDEGRVDYDIQVPQNVMVAIHAATGPVKTEGVNGDLSIDADTGQVEVRDVSNAHVRVRTINGPVTLTNVRGNVEATSVGGQVTMDNVTGTQVTANTTAGGIRYTGDFAGGGEYSLSTHSGNIDVALPASASVDITARTITGSVQNNFPLQPDVHPAIPLAQGRSFAGRANAGASSARLRTFSGTIRVQKQ